MQDEQISKCVVFAQNIKLFKEPISSQYWDKIYFILEVLNIYNFLGWVRKILTTEILNTFHYAFNTAGAKDWEEKKNFGSHFTIGYII